jgi:hypothetical protein
MTTDRIRNGASKNASIHAREKTLQRDLVGRPAQHDYSCGLASYEINELWAGQSGEIVEAWPYAA